jgi:hypothetical protein
MTVPDPQQGGEGTYSRYRSGLDALLRIGAKRIDMRIRTAVVMGVGTSVLCLALVLGESPRFAAVRGLGQNEMASIAGGKCVDCKTNGQAGTEADCKRCVKTGENWSKRCNKGTIGKICKAISHDEWLWCDMDGSLVCANVPSGGKWQYWDGLNEDCLGMPNREEPAQYVIETASGDDCP